MLLDLTNMICKMISYEFKIPCKQGTTWMKQAYGRE